MKAIIKLIAWILVVIGALNWGLVGLFDFNLVESIFGMGTLTNIIYDIVGLSALVLVVLKVMKK
jgi:uncharacterized membrane protein YuzA (DUF378 family)